jgi:hypothetical protein
MRARRTSILWLACADARGHLMRAHLVRGALAPRGIDVRVVTTSREGQSFLARLGTRAELLSQHYAVAFDAAQNLDRAGTDACILRYLLDPDRAATDAARLRALVQDATLCVNDFHPVPLLLPRRLGAPVVHVYGTHLWQAIAHHLHGRVPDAMDRAAAALAASLRDRAFAHIEHGLTERDGVLPPIVAAPTRSRDAVRASILGPSACDRRLAAVYLNPHFRDARIADAIEHALASRGYAMHAVGEGFAQRAGWRGCDRAFNDVAAAADVLVSAPGMGAIAAWAHFGTPLLALVTDQPEQAANARDLAIARCAPYATLDAARADHPSIAHALDTLALSSCARDARPDPAVAARCVQNRWVDAIERLTQHAAPMRATEMTR